MDWIGLTGLSPQIDGFGHVFAAGDVTDLAEEKLAQNAMKHADVVAKNISMLIASPLLPHSRLRTYTPGERIMVISIGPHFALMIRVCVSRKKKKEGKRALTESIKGDWIVIEGSVPMHLKSATEGIMARTIRGWF